MSRIRLRIDRIVLNGLRPGQEGPLIDSLRAGLSEALAGGQTRAPWGRSRLIPLLRLGRMPLDAGPSGGRTLGSRLARGIGRGLKP